MRRAFLKIFLIIFFSFVGIFSFVSRSRATTNDFTHTINAHYSIKEDRSASVEFNFTTTNQVSNNYLKDFLISLPFEPKGLNSASSATPVEIVKVEKDFANKYILHINISNPVFGEKSSFNWQINFDVDEIIKKHSSQNAIFLPTFNDNPSIEDYAINISVPESFGEVQYAYGEAEISKVNNFSELKYEKKKNNIKSLTILTGSDTQSYLYETGEIIKKTTTLLPMINPYQEVIYSQFDPKSFDLKNLHDLNQADIDKNQKIAGQVITKKDYDKVYSDTKEPIDNSEIINLYAKQISTENATNYDIAKQIMSLIKNQFNISNYIIDLESSGKIDTSKSSLTILEINKLFREMLTHFKVENRGAFGYSYPLNSNRSDTENLEQTVWSEFWDGEKWILVNPVWYLTSEGSDYFDKNNFLHIKFGNYLDNNELISFISSASIIKLIPEESPKTTEKILNISSESFNQVFLNKEYSLTITNESNQPIKLNSLEYELEGLDKINLLNKKNNLNKYLQPNSSIDFTISLDYGLITKDQTGKLKVLVNYSDLEGEKKNDTFTHEIKVKGNAPNYMVQIILGLILIMILGSMISLFIYKKYD